MKTKSQLRREIAEAVAERNYKAVTKLVRQLNGVERKEKQLALENLPVTRSCWPWTILAPNQESTEDQAA